MFDCPGGAGGKVRQKAKEAEIQGKGSRENNNNCLLADKYIGFLRHSLVPIFFFTFLDFFFLIRKNCQK